MNKKRKKTFLNLSVFVITLLVSLLAAEGFFRIKDQQPLFGELELLRKSIDPKAKEKIEWLSLHLVEEKHADPMLASLYPVEPKKRFYGTVRSETKQLKDDYPEDKNRDKKFNVVKAWNKKFISGVYCEHVNGWYTKNMVTAGSFVYTFKPPGDSRYPIFRYFPNSVHNKFRVNDFGWGGDAVALIKPDSTIRIAFLGASTTQQRGRCDYAYPDYVGQWLNEWAKMKKIPIKFEVINTGRVGLSSMDFAAIMKYELVPAEPDITIYYEGRNQMVTRGISCSCNAHRNPPYNLLKRFALFRKIVEATGHNILQHVEHLKDTAILEIPDKVDVKDPDITSPLLPINLPQILSDLDSIRLWNEQINGTFVLCSFGMLTNEEMLTKGMKFASVYSYWMHQFPGLRLRDIGLLNGIENNAFKSYCEKNGVQFIDVAKDLTRLPEAFDDGIHLSCEGMKYHAWIVFLNLLPVIEKHLENGTLPKPATQTATQHPYIMDSFERVPLPYRCN